VAGSFEQCYKTFLLSNNGDVSRSKLGDHLHKMVGLNLFEGTSRNFLNSKDSIPVLI